MASLLSFRLRIAARMQSPTVCDCVWTASACRSMRACSLTKNAFGTSVRFPTIPFCSVCKYHKSLLNKCVCVCSATPVGIVVVRGDCDLETCRLYIDRLQEVSTSSLFLYRSSWSCQSNVAKAKYLLDDYHTSPYNKQDRRNFLFATLTHKCDLCFWGSRVVMIRYAHCRYKWLFFFYII